LTLISLDEARTLLLEDLPPLESERVDVDDCLGRALAGTVVATHSQPAEPRATMDGIVVPDAAPTSGSKWQLAGNVAAGAMPAGRLEPGQALRIATGAVVPQGATRVLPQEILRFSDNEVELVAEPAEARFIRQPGADFTLGDRLLAAGDRISPGALGLLAAAGCASVDVVREPRIGICTAGDELIRPGAILREGQSIDSAGHSLAALVRGWGGAPRIDPILPDAPSAITSAIVRTVGECDVLICVGGASVGSRDFFRPAVRALGARFLFEGIALQPGKPCWHARIDESTLIVGLPGNPTSAFVCAHLLLQPLIGKLMNRKFDRGLRPACLATPLAANGAREQYLRATASLDAEGRLWAEPLPDQDSGLQATLAKAQLLIRRLPGAEPLDRGAHIEILELAGARAPQHLGRTVN
jgi:molybdopterin molybdotransferase